MAGTVLPVEQVYGGNPYRDDYQPQKTEIIQYLKNLEAMIAGTDLPGLTEKSYIVAFNTVGAPNAITADTDIPVPAIDGGALIALPIVADNTAKPVTVSFNGAAALTVKTSSGNDVSVGGLTAGMIAAGYVSGSTFRLLTDQASAAIVADAEAAADRAEAAVPNVFPATRAALKAVDPAVNSVAYLLEEGRRGQFVWTAGDLSVLVDADPREGIYVESDREGLDKTIGAWVRIHDGKKNVKWYGAVGDGLTDDATAFAAAVAAGGRIVFPEGHYLISVGTIRNIANGDIVELIGDSMRGTVLDFSGSGNLLQFDIIEQINRFSASSASIAVQNMTLMPGAQGIGGGILVNLPDDSAGPGSYDGLVRSFTDLLVVGKTSADYFDVALKCRNVTFGRIARVLGFGGDGYLGTFIEVDGTKDGVGNIFDEINGQSFHRGLHVHGRNEGSTLVNSQLYLCDYPVDFDLDVNSPGEIAQPLVEVMNTHITCDGSAEPNPVALHVGNAAQLHIGGCDIYANVPGATAVSIQNPDAASQANITKGSISESTINSDQSAGTTGIAFANNAQAITVDDTVTISGFETAVTMDATTAAIDVSKTKFLSNVTDVVDESAGNKNRVNRDWRVVKQSNVPSSVTGSTSTTNLAQITVPARAMGPNGKLRVTVQYSLTPSASGKTLDVVLNAAQVLSEIVTDPSYTSYRKMVEIGNRNSNASQIVTSEIDGASSSPIVTTTVNTAADVTVTIRGTLGNAADTIVLESYSVEVLYSP